MSISTILEFYDSGYFSDLETFYHIALSVNKDNLETALSSIPAELLSKFRQWVFDVEESELHYLAPEMTLSESYRRKAHAAESVQMIRDYLNKK